MTRLSTVKKARLEVLQLLILSGLLMGSVLPATPINLAVESTISWPQISLTRTVGGLGQPTYITHADDGSGRLFVVKQVGDIRIIKNGVLQHTPFLDITNRVLSRGAEQGLLSVAFPPGYASKGHFYVYYTNTSGNIVVARYFLTSNPDVANSKSEQIILTIDHPQFRNHNGGQLAFGPDGYLYISTGDGGGEGDPFNNAQNNNSLLGKLLRIDVESGSGPYTIPLNNPYRQTGGYRGEIWALGLRNPWRFSFDRAMGNLYIADVGQNLYEEIDVQPASSTGGENYGWRIMEGNQCYKNTTCNQTGLVLPVVQYDHSQGCAIIGGVVYHGHRYPPMQGIYFYGDYCSGRIWGLKRSGTAWENTLLLNAPFRISSFGEDGAGNLYVADYSNGGIYMITETSQNPMLSPPSTSPTPSTR